jgi:hypothetical protein
MEMKKIIMLAAFLALPAFTQQRATPAWAPAFEAGKSPFEVSASTYAWEVHDEGVELMLDNMQRTAGVNSVYLIALMHHEPRPLLGDRFPHNPVRGHWFAEDSRAYWHPDPSLYGRIKPQLSDHAWLRETDWLKVTAEAARKRGLKTGVEISHTPLSRDFLLSPGSADLVQRDISGKPAGGRVPMGCLNHPDVQAYLLALYKDLAKNYKLDYIQTCMINFVEGDATRGGCFCPSCVAAARAEGLDLETAKQALLKDPNAQPHKDQWQAFRRRSVTSLYRKITDAIRAIDPKIDFRLNNFTRSARNGGLFIEDIAPMLGSIRIMEYSEQYGDPTRMPQKTQWLADVRQAAGPALPLLSAVAVRAKATPELIRQGVRIAVESGVRGVTLGHYDGAAPSMLRAVWSGLAEAGVPGVEPKLGVEGERMRLDNYFSNPYLLETCANTPGKGTATYAFQGPGGVYDLRVSYADEKGGQGRMTVFVGGRQVDSWRLDKDGDCWMFRTMKSVTLNKGDEIRIVGEADGPEWARIDWVEFIPRDVR